MSLKKIETLKVEVVSSTEIKFEDLLSSKDFDGKEKHIYGKDVALRILENNEVDNIIVGIIETSRKANVPPKKNFLNKTISSIGLGKAEGLVYANIFIYDTSRKIIMYEVNKNGCYLDHFMAFFYKCSKDKDSKYTDFNLKLTPVLKKNEYIRLGRLDYIKSIEIEVANPKEIEIEEADKNGAMSQMISTAASLGSTKVRAKFNVGLKNENVGLLSTPINHVVQFARKILMSNNSPNIKKILISGYDTDSDSPNKLEPIDLVADRYLKTIELTEPRENNDLLESQRSLEIKTLHQKCCDDFDMIFGKNG